MMDVSEEAELLMLRLVEGRRFVCRLELTEEGREWMGWLAEEGFVRAGVRLVEGLPLLASGQTCYSITIPGRRRIAEIEKRLREAEPLRRAGRAVAGLVTGAARVALEALVAEAVSGLGR